MIASWFKSTTCTKEERQALFERLMRESSRQAYAMAYRLAGSQSEAEDLLQETYVRAFRFFHRYDEGMPFTGWLYRIMTNIHIDIMRRRNRLKTVSMEQSGPEGNSTWDLPDTTASADENVMESVLEEPIQLGLRSMNPEFRTAVVLADVEGMSYEDIAAIMNTSVGTVRSRIHRGRRLLRSYLVASDPDRFAAMAAEVEL